MGQGTGGGARYNALGQGSRWPTWPEHTVCFCSAWLVKRWSTCRCRGDSSEDRLPAGESRSSGPVFTGLAAQGEASEIRKQAAHILPSSMCPYSIHLLIFLPFIYLFSLSIHLFINSAYLLSIHPSIHLSSTLPFIQTIIYISICPSVCIVRSIYSPSHPCSRV